LEAAATTCRRNPNYSICGWPYRQPEQVQIAQLHRAADLAAFRRGLSAARLAWAVAKIHLFAEYLGILMGPSVTYKPPLWLGWVKASATHNIFALLVLSYMVHLQGDEGIDDAVLDTAMAMLYKNPMYRPRYQFFVFHPTQSAPRSEERPVGVPGCRGQVLPFITRSRPRTTDDDIRER
jgi:hypothetical protein